jgi:bifunctional non-homologous end joining protein LigD
MYPDVGVTKLDLARYYEAVSEWMLPHVVGRPLTLVFCPRGIAQDCRFLKHGKAWGPGALRRVHIREKTKIGEYMVVDDLAGLVSLIQMNWIETHTWNSTTDHLEQPDRLVLDLDPGPRIVWRQVVEAARLTRALLLALRLQSWVKTTGGRGLHVVVPLRPERDWRECLALARACAEALVRQRPALYTTELAKAGREDKILIDYLRNNRTNTSIAAFSPRARPGAPVSTPVAWEQLTPRLSPARFRVKSLPARWKRQPADPWAGYWNCDQRFPEHGTDALDALDAGS